MIFFGINGKAPKSSGKSFHKSGGYCEVNVECNEEEEGYVGGTWQVTRCQTFANIF